MIKSPLRYPGGKSRIAKYLVENFPDFAEYREPFLGGGSVFIEAKRRFFDKKFWVNDAYFDLFKFWEQVQIDVDGIIENVQNLKAKFADGKELYKHLKTNDLDLGAKFFVFNRITFSGTTLSGGYSNAAFRGRFTTSSIERLKPLPKLLEKVKITNFDYADLISAKGENVFLYLDPPYFSAQKSMLYGNRGNLHKDFDYEKFAVNLKSCKHKWLLTLDDCEYIRELFKFAEIQPLQFSYGMRNVKGNSNQTGKELLIKNY
ncbi:MAG: DNA adenine methylase [Pyrinomonadaceae bacterium]|nr:DNA adenine methylase [Pyrinomonadaceae bacterium]